MSDHWDVEVHDEVVLDEISMMTELIIATSESEGPLPQSQIDAILGLTSAISQPQIDRPQAAAVD